MAEMSNEDVALLNTYRLNFGEVLHYADGLVELIADEGLVATYQDVSEMFEFFEILEPRPQAALVNRKHDYSLSFEAQRCIKAYKGVRFVAILTHSRLAYLAARFAISRFFKIGVFMDRKDAMAWLRRKTAGK